MSSQIDNFTALLRSFGDSHHIYSDAVGNANLAGRPLVNAHVHLPPNFTAFDTIDQALKLADQQDVRVLGASNYYDYSVYSDFAAGAMHRGIFPLFGLEIISLIDELVQSSVRINDPGNPGKMYLCGKGITRFAPMADDASALLQVIRDNDSARMAAITDKLAALFADAGVETGLDADTVKARVAARHECAVTSVYLQERHIAQAFQEVFFSTIPEDGRIAFLTQLYGTAPKAGAGDAVGVQNDIRSFLLKAGKPAFVSDTFVDFDHARRLVLALGGIPCYPTLADGVSPITQYEEDTDALIADLKARGIPSAEYIPNRNTPETLSRYVHAMRDAGLVVTAGTEHNTLDLLPIAPVCVNDVPIPDDIQEIFWEGACVVAAHQSLTLLGKPGYINRNGQLNADYASDDERITAFRAIGERLISRYCAASTGGL